MRGRVLFVFYAELHRLDTAGSAAVDPDGAGPLTSGYDPDFREPVLVDTNDDGIGESVRMELPPVRVPCQVEPGSFEALHLYAAGNSPDARLVLVFHFQDLERLGLVDAASGDPLIRPGDRLGAVYDSTGGLVQAVRTPPGLYVKELRPTGFGLPFARPRRNLLLAVFEPRATAAPRGGAP